MKPFPHLSIIRVMAFSFVLVVFTNCKKDSVSTNPSQLSPESIPQSVAGNTVASASTISQTRTATFLNNLNNFQQVFGTQNYSRVNAENVKADDDVYANTKKLSAASRTRNANGASSSLALQGFGFDIPANAAIENISVKVRRFKKGSIAISDYFVSVMRRYDCSNDDCIYGFMWRNGDVYPGNSYPDTETEYDFLQNGSGNNGGFNHDEAYEWTPAMVNHQYFGVRIDTNPIVGRGSVIVYYDLVEVTVQYSLL